MITEKTGFRVRFSKNNSTFEVELLKTGLLCSTAKAQNITLIYHGEVIGESRPLKATEILEEYLRHSTAAFDGFDGAFVLLFLNEPAKTVVVVTDRLNGMKCFLEETSEAYFLVSSLCFLPRKQRALDRIGVTSFLANGVVYCNRTVFEGVHSLERASFHTFGPKGDKQYRSYWEYQFDRRFASKARKELKNELADLLVHAAKRRVTSSETIHLSLSGGYDSTCILGLLWKLHPKDVRCFSYVVDDGSTGSDESVAAQMAGIAGFPHRSVPIFNGDIIGLIQRNAALGEGRANFCGELDAWEGLQEETAPGDVFFVGDECFGWSDCRIKTVDDLLASIPIQLSRVLSGYGNCIRSLGSGFDEEILGLCSKSRQVEMHDTKDFLYLDQRLGNVIAPWRELFGGRSVPLRNTLLDKGILEFTTHLPTSLRRGKKLYKETVRMMFPELFRVRRAFKPALDPIPAALHRDKAKVKEALFSGTSQLDGLIDLEKCAALLDLATGEQKRSLKKQVILFGKRMFKENPLAHSFRGMFPPTPMNRVDPIVLLIRILTLREYLRKTEIIHNLPTERIA
jgi:asparagine synthase (glutamine-hydrolysing)